LGLVIWRNESTTFLKLLPFAESRWLYVAAQNGSRLMNIGYLLPGILKCEFSLSSLCIGAANFTRAAACCKFTSRSDEAGASKLSGELTRENFVFFIILV
jgi:hypothetical protein